MKKFYLALWSTLLFLLLLLGTYWIHIWYFKVDVVLYSALFDGVLAVIGSSVCILFWKKFDILNSFEKLQLTVIWLLGGYVFAISIPTVIDRSLSFYILEKIQQRGGGIRLESFEDVFTKEYVYEYRLVDVRLTEQQNSGTIKIENGCVKLTKLGQEIATFGRFFQKNFLPKQRLLMGSYTDVLTNTFRDTSTNLEYECN